MSVVVSIVIGLTPQSQLKCVKKEEGDLPQYQFRCIISRSSCLAISFCQSCFYLYNYHSIRLKKWRLYVFIRESIFYINNAKSSLLEEVPMADPEIIVDSRTI